MTKNTKRNWTEEIANRFIEELEAGTTPWVKPWSNWFSWSRQSGNYYTGINQMLLGGGEFLTFNQIKEAGGHLNKGSKGNKVIYYSEYMKKEKDEEGNETEKPSKFIKTYTVFNVCDTDLERKHDKETGKRHEWDAIEKAEEIIADYTKRAGVQIKYGENKAYNTHHYITGEVMGLPIFEEGNFVVLPQREQFKSAGQYYSTIFHKLTHSTSEAAGRDLSKYALDKKERAREELVAEIGAAYILSYLGIEKDNTFAQSARYVEGWASHLKDDKAAILYATPQAIKAANMILNIAE